MMIDLKPFKLDIDELVNEFAQGGSTKLADMKANWRSRKFSFIFEASLSTNHACFMQSLFSHFIGYMLSKNSLSHRLGELYCLFETQPFKPSFKIYLIYISCQSMQERNMFLFGYLDVIDGSATERINELTDIQDACVQVAYKKLFANTRIKHFIDMDLGMELDVDLLKRKSSEYAIVKELTIKEADEVMDVQNIKHNTENKQLIGDVVEKIAEDWNLEKGLFYQQIGVACLSSGEQETNKHSRRQRCDDNVIGKEADNFVLHDDFGSIKEHADNEDNFGNELEAALLCLPYEDEETKDVKQQDDKNFETLEG